MTKAPRPTLQQTAQQIALLADALPTQRPIFNSSSKEQEADFLLTV